MICTGDISELYDIDLTDHVIAARPDPKVAMVPEFVDYVEKALDILESTAREFGIELPRRNYD